MQKRLYRSRDNRMLWGVCGGLAEYFNIDPTIVRIIFVILIFANGIGLLLYLIMALVVPLEGSTSSTPRDTLKENVTEMRDTAAEMGRDVRSDFTGSRTEADSRARSNTVLIIGLLLIVLGAIFLIGTLDLFPWWRWSFLWPLILVAVGVLIIIAAWRK